MLQRPQEKLCTMFESFSPLLSKNHVWQGLEQDEIAIQRKRFSKLFVVVEVFY